MLKRYTSSSHTDAFMMCNFFIVLDIHNFKSTFSSENVFPCKKAN